MSSKAFAEHKIVVLEQKEQELQAFIQQLSIDLQKVSTGAWIEISFCWSVYFLCEPSVLLPGLARLHSCEAATQLPRLLNRKDSISRCGGTYL